MLRHHTPIAQRQMCALTAGIVAGLNGDGFIKLFPQRPERPFFRAGWRQFQLLNGDDPDALAVINQRRMMCTVINQEPFAGKTGDKMLRQKRQHLIFRLNFRDQYAVSIGKTDKTLEQMGFVAQMLHGLPQGINIVVTQAIDDIRPFVVSF